MTTSEHIVRSLGRLESSMDACREDIKDLKQEAVGRLNDHGKRLGSLETDRTFVRRIAGTLIAGATVVAGYFGLK